jgi:anti-anti-sigma factor
MKIQEQRQGAVTVVRPEGALIETDVPLVRSRLDEVRRTTLGRFVLDCTALPYVDSRGLEALVDLTESMAQVGQSLRICGVNETLREVLEINDLSRLFEQYDDVNSAVRSFL